MDIELLEDKKNNLVFDWLTIWLNAVATRFHT